MSRSVPINCPSPKKCTECGTNRIRIDGKHYCTNCVMALSETLPIELQPVKLTRQTGQLVATSGSHKRYSKRPSEQLEDISSEALDRTSPRPN